MSPRRPSPRRLVWAVVQGWFAAVVVVIAALMITTRIRVRNRANRGDGFPRVPPVAVPVGEATTITTYTYGDDLYDDMLTAIAGAQERILFESFIFKGDAMGQRFKRALVRAAERGVDVRIVYDGFANLVVSPSFLRFPAPVQVLRYPLISGWFVFNPRRWGRDHRKILVVDDTAAFVGGYNVGSEYATEWRDTHLKVEGGSVWDLDNAFVDFWNLNARRLPMLKDRGSPSWDPRVRAHRNLPRQLVFPVRGMYLEAMDRATDHIYLTAAYFIPDRDILQAIKDARDRGVDVQILVPWVSNHVVADWLSRGFYGEMLRHGVRIFRYRDAMVHAKTATIDGRWSTVGTANIDRLSLTGNYEINLEIHDDDLTKHLETVFASDLDNATELTLDEWESRDIVVRACELLLAPLRPLL
ncbi:phospholipase D-like domain-containing protein [Aeromicrobium sp.]|uniref:phospholipase D-like domain-containing protein n=1 Tax=Aeromicrobium sp. TaxID=1871063 RepID=UPI003D6BCCFB